MTDDPTDPVSEWDWSTRLVMEPDGSRRPYISVALHDQVVEKLQGAIKRLQAENSILRREVSVLRPHTRDIVDSGGRKWGTSAR